MSDSKIQQVLIKRGRAAVRSFQSYVEQTDNAQSKQEKELFNQKALQMAAHIEEICCMASALNVMTYDECARLIHL